ncbi:MAG: hypothetical protein HC857_02150 [Synechococcales cyanobacterium RU_4_20]|nr:hypothetical protein [Synechococcales cyanobacterium RU_4_20]
MSPVIANVIPRSEMKKAITVLCLFFVSSCGLGHSEISKELETQMRNNDWEKIDLSQVGGSAWQRVCVLGPYSDNSRAEHALGFKWDLEKKTSVLSSDSVNVLAFVEGKDVIAYVEHPRTLGDFAQLSGQCFDRVNATLVRDKTTKGNWVSFVTPK